MLFWIPILYNSIIFWHWNVVVTAVKEALGNISCSCYCLRLSLKLYERITGLVEGAVYPAVGWCLDTSHLNFMTMDEDPTLYGFLVHLFTYSYHEPFLWFLPPTTIFKAFWASCQSTPIYMISEVFGSILVIFFHTNISQFMWIDVLLNKLSLPLPPSSHQHDFAAASPWCFCPVLSRRRPMFLIQKHLRYHIINYYLKFLFLFPFHVYIPF